MIDPGQTTTSIEVAAMVPAALLLVIGLLLCVAGARVLRTAFATIGGLIGIGLGLSLAQNLDFGVPPWAAAVTGGLVLAILASLGCRVAVALLFAALLGSGGPALVWTAATNQWVNFGEIAPLEAPADDASPDAPEPVDAAPMGLDEDDPTRGLPPELADLLRPILGDDDPLGDGSGIGDQVAEGLATVSETMGFEAGSEGESATAATVTRAINAVQTRWAAAPPRLRLSLLGAASLGILSGLLLAGFARAFTARAVTAAAGAALVVTAGSALATTAGLGDSPILPASAGSWTLTWLIIALIGMAVQLRFRPRLADKTG